MVFYFDKLVYMTSSSKRTMSTLIVLAFFSVLAKSQLLHAPADSPSFEVVSIKLNDPKVLFILNQMGSQRIVRVVGTEKGLIQQAFNASSPQRVAGFSKIDDHQMYRIEATIPDEIFAQMQSRDAAFRQHEVQAMLQVLLKERFGLEFHFGTKVLPTYDIVIAKGGSKLPEPRGPSDSLSGGWAMSPTGDMRVRNVKLEEFVQFSPFDLGDRVIMNKTGLDGRYDFTFHWRRPQASSPFGVSAAGNFDDAGPSIFSALKDQLGLELVSNNESAEVLYVDKIHDPTSN